MTISDVLAVIAIAISAIALWRTIHHDRTRDINAVSIFATSVTGEITEASHDEIILRNDGDRSVTVSNVGTAYGTLYTTQRHKPEGWAVITDRQELLLVPGETLRIPAPDDPSDVNIIGPIARVTDSRGVEWHRLPGRRWRATPVVQPTRRRDQWFEQQKWWLKLDTKVTGYAVKRTNKRPGQFPILAILIDRVWGWRPGYAGLEPRPVNAPRGWRYATFAEWDLPEVDTTPTYIWRGDD